MEIISQATLQVPGGTEMILEDFELS